MSEYCGFQPFVRFLPYSYDILAENLLDPAHFPVAHHKADPLFDRSFAKPLFAKHFEGLGTFPTMFGMEYVPQNDTYELGLMELRHPGILASAFADRNQRSIEVFFYFLVVPVSPEKSLVLTVGDAEKDLFSTKKPNIIMRAMLRLACWSFHTLVLNKVFDGDNVLLQVQDEKLKEQENLTGKSRRYYSPTSADLLCTAFRQWFETVGGKGADYGGDQAYSHGRRMTKEELLDRYEQHTKHCKVCSQALESIQRTISVLKVVSVSAFVVGSFLLLKNITQESVTILSVLKSRGIIMCTVFFILSALMASLLKKHVIPQFYFIDVCHAEND